LDVHDGPEYALLYENLQTTAWSYTIHQIKPSKLSTRAVIEHCLLLIDKNRKLGEHGPVLQRVIAL